MADVLSASQLMQISVNLQIVTYKYNKNYYLSMYVKAMGIILFYFLSILFYTWRKSMNPWA